MCVLYTGVVSQVHTREKGKGLTWVIFVLSSILALDTLIFETWPHVELGALHIS